MIRTILCTLTAAAEAGFAVGVTEFLKLFSVRDTRTAGIFTVYPNTDRNLIHGLPSKDDNWWKSWFLFKVDTHSVNGLAEIFQSGWATGIVGKQARPTPWGGFYDFYRTMVEDEVSWNSFSLDRIHSAGERIRRGEVRPIDPAPQAASSVNLSYRERKNAERAFKDLKDKISALGKAHRKKAAVANEGIVRKTRLVAALPSSSPGSRNPRSAGDEDEETLASLSRKREALDSSSSRLVKAKPSGDGKDPERISSVSSQALGKEVRTDLEYWKSSGGRSSGGRDHSSSQERTEVGNIYRCFSTRSGTPLPTFDHWRPESRDIFIRHANHSVQAAVDFNEMVRYYESLLKSSASTEEVEAAWKTIAEMKAASEADTVKLEQLEKENQNRKGVILAYESTTRADAEKFKLLSSEYSALQSSTSSLRKELDAAKIKHEELTEKLGEERSQRTWQTAFRAVCRTY